MSALSRATAIGVAVMAAGCATPGTGEKRVSPARSELEAIHSALDFLCDSQLRDGAEQAGHWRQWLGIGHSFGTLEIPDPNGFTPAEIHGNLSLISERNADTLKLDPAQLDRARDTRLAALRTVLSHRRPASSHAAGAFGYWREPKPRGPLRRLAAAGFERFVDLEPKLYGTLAPSWPRTVPAKGFIWPDADTTATAYRALSDHAEIDAGTLDPDPPDAAVFGRWLDTSDTHRFAPTEEVLPSSSGVFLTWFNDPSKPRTPNDADIVVNANVLYALGRLGRLETPGVHASVDWILRAVTSGRPLNDFSPHYQHRWYPHAGIARAYGAGGVSSLAPAVRQLADEVEDSAQRHADGSVSWPGQSPVIATACAAAVLIYSERPGPLLDGAIAYLVRAQNADGSWPVGWVELGKSESGMRWSVKSPAAGTAIVMAVLCEYRLRVGGRGKSAPP